MESINKPDLLKPGAHEMHANNDEKVKVMEKQQDAGAEVNHINNLMRLIREISAERDDALRLVARLEADSNATDRALEIVLRNAERDSARPSGIEIMMFAERVVFPLLAHMLAPAPTPPPEPQPPEEHNE